MRSVPRAVWYRICIANGACGISGDLSQYVALPGHAGLCPGRLFKSLAANQLCMDNLNNINPTAEEPKTCTQDKPSVAFLEIIYETTLPNPTPNLVENHSREALKPTPENEDVKSVCEKEAEKPDCEKEAEKPDCEKEGEKPDCEKEAEKPDCEKEAEKPDCEKEGEKPDCEKEAEKPDCEKEAEKPDYEKEAEKPDCEKEAEKPDCEKESVKPTSEEETLNPAVEEPEKPKYVTESVKSAGEREIVELFKPKRIIKPSSEKKIVKISEIEEIVEPAVGKKMIKLSETEKVMKLSTAKDTIGLAVKNDVIRSKIVSKNPESKLKTKDAEAQKQEGENSSLNINKPEVTKKNKKKKFSKSARKMFFRYLQQGFPPNKARKLAAAYDLKRNNGSPANDDLKCEHSIKTTASQVGSSVRLAILPEIFPHILLNNNQMMAIQKDILNRVQAQKEKSIKPAFLGVTTGEGYLVLECANEETAGWVESLNGKLSSVKGLELKIVKEELLNKRYTAVMSFPKSSSESISSILDFIQSQNEGVITDNWKVERRTDTKQATEIKFSIDFASVETLRKKLSGLNYKWGQIAFTLEEGEAKPLKRKKRANLRKGKRKTTRSGQEDVPFMSSDQKQAFLNSWFGYLEEIKPLNPWSEGPSSASSFQNCNVNLNRADPFQNYRTDQSREFSNQRDEEFVKTSYESPTTYSKKLKNEYLSRTPTYDFQREYESSQFGKQLRRKRARRKFSGEFSHQRSSFRTPERKLNLAEPFKTPENYF